MPSEVWKTRITVASIALLPLVLVGILLVLFVLPPIRVETEVRLPVHDNRQVIAIDRPHNPEPGFAPGAPPPDHVTRRRPFHVRTNSIGLRGPELSDPKTRPRLLCVGDSVTFGWGVSYEDTWCVRLARRHGMEPVIGAWPGAHPDSSLTWIRDNAAALQADIVLFTWAPAFDNHELWLTLWNIRGTRRALGDIKLGWVLPPIGTFDPIGKVAVEQTYPTLARRAPSGVPVLNLTPLFRDKLPLPGVIGDLSGGRHRLIKLPENDVLIDVPEPPPDPIYGDLLAEEIIAAFEADPTMQEPLFFDQGHPDEAGFRLMAEEVSRWLVGLGWVDAGR